MDNVQYIDFLNAAWELAGKLAHDNIELVEPDGSDLKLDPECELRLCVENPEKLEETKECLAEFIHAADYACKNKEK